MEPHDEREVGVLLPGLAVVRALVDHRMLWEWTQALVGGKIQELRLMIGNRSWNLLAWMNEEGCARRLSYAGKLVTSVGSIALYGPVVFLVARTEASGRQVGNMMRDDWRALRALGIVVPWLGPPEQEVP
jgi:hypothetical protein